MLPAIARDQRGWRQFAPDDLEWLIVLARLRATGMPLKAVREFAASAQSAEAETPTEHRKDGFGIPTNCLVMEEVSGVSYTQTQKFK